MAKGIDDLPMLEYLNTAILDLEAEKAVLHSKSDK